MVHRLLERDGLDTLYLHYRDTVRHARHVIAVLKPYFPRYLFVGAPAGRLYGVNQTIGVSTVLYNGDEPLEIPFEVIKELRSRGDDNGCVTMSKKQRERWREGQRVRIVAGPLAGFFGQVELDKGNAVTVWVEMFKKRVKSTVDPRMLSPVRRSLS